jgi:hypothetical protein
MTNDDNDDAFVREFLDVMESVLRADVVVTINATPLGAQTDGTVGHGVEVKLFPLTDTLAPREFAQILRTFLEELDADLEMKNTPEGDTP